MALTEAERAKRYREKKKGVTDVVTTEEENVTVGQESVTRDDGCLYSVTGHRIRGPLIPVELSEDMKLRIELLAAHGGGWADVARDVTSPAPGMPNLERMQRIAGSLGKYTDDVWYGDKGLTMGDIGKVIGTLPPLIGK
jgi:hypothetical protein